MIKFKLYEIDESDCRIYYKTQNNDGDIIYYCLQNNGIHATDRGVNLYRCTEDGEPQNIAKLKPDRKAIDLFELPIGDTKLIKACIEWIRNN